MPHQHHGPDHEVLIVYPSEGVVRPGEGLVLPIIRIPTSLRASFRQGGVKEEVVSSITLDVFKQIHPIKRLVDSVVVAHPA